jgi:predicted nucleotide-binding protein (sugar kinase/HSP70/actin superfamily)
LLCYNLELLSPVDRETVEAGLKYTHNDVCSASTLVTGQMMEAVPSKRYDLNKASAIITSHYHHNKTKGGRQTV